jgi:putative transposase
VIRAYRFPLRALAQERAALWSCLRQCCTLYNAALEQRNTAWKKHGKSIGYVDQCRDLTDLREEPEWSAVASIIQRSALRRVDRGFQNFFRRCKAGEKPGHPRYRAFDRYDSFGIGRAAVEPADREGGSGYVHVPKIGRVRFKQHRLMQGTVCDVTIRRDARSRWFVQIACDVGAAPPKRVAHAHRTTGIDLGLTTFAVLADGTEIDNPRHFRKSSEALARRQMTLAQKKRGSSSRRRARVLVARTHEHIANHRLDFHRKLAKQLVSTYDVIYHEDLNIRGLARGRLAKSVHDVGWGQFIRILHCKAEEAGVYAIAVDSRGTTNTCSRCGHVEKKTISQREHLCSMCGLALGRDHNSALMVHARGLRAVLPAQAPEASF